MWDRLGAEHLRALLTAAVDDLLRLAASVLGGGDAASNDNGPREPRRANAEREPLHLITHQRSER